MARPRGVLNKNALKQLQASASASGLLRVRIDIAGNVISDVYAEVAEFQKNSAFIAGAGRLVVTKGSYYIPEYTTRRLGSSVQQSAGSGFLTQSPGVYFVKGSVAVSGVAIETYAGAVTVDGVVASGTQTFTPASATSAAVVNVGGIVHALSGQRLNIGVRSLHGNITTIGTEDTGGNAPAANLVVMKLPSELTIFFA